MKRYVRSSQRITANSEIGRYRGITYGLEDDHDMRYYFVDEDGKIEYAETEDEIRDKIDIHIDARKHE